jgi:hypothetical protein
LISADGYDFFYFTGEFALMFLLLLLLLLQKFYNNTVSQEQVNELYKKWGGIPRYVLEKANRRDDQNELDVAISQCTTHDIMTYAGSEATPEHISKLLHMIVERDPPIEGDEEPQVIDRYSTYHIDVASDYVTKRLTGISLHLFCPLSKCN